MENPARWAEDPTGVFTHRYWDGSGWTDRVAIDGREARSAPDAPRTEAERVAAQLRRPPPPPGAGPAPPPPPTAASVPAAPGPPAPVATSNNLTQVGPVFIGTRRVSSIGRRLGAWVLDGVLVLVTCGIGWLVWGAISAAKAQTPGKQLLGLQVVDTRTGRPLDWATYVLWRGGIGFVGGLILGTIVVGVFAYLMPLFNDRNQHFYGLLTNSAVVDV